ncbi:hypothetical protein DYBT9623_02425 [Dyadobacter sp. CECT 9623]|jgi:hypothetical protein|uniref:Lipoprotein n=1 Tax=Dyadobacter linearis TaxID=2823330 RepID=A0ABM8UQC2_9BACT|nr:hypothetical protein [Dyadobacter sp. CECT 9623]CAG5069688.1 hypothetical protein DYBT9623_02425 [Dyadobacter sp. CECT 9623]
MKKLLLIISGICCVFSCKNGSIDKRDEGLAYKETIEINASPRTTLTFFDFSDGRCPEDVNCIWEGHTSVDLLLSSTTEGGITEHVEMCLGGCSFFRKDTTEVFRTVNDTVVKSFAGQQYRFILSSLTPARKSTDIPKKENHRITLTIEKQ